MAFKPGKPKTGGRQPGSPNKITGAFREAVQYVYDNIGGHAAFSTWAKENPTEFYKIASRLIPVELRDVSDKTVHVHVHRGGMPASVLDVHPMLTDESGPSDGALSHDAR